MLPLRRPCYSGPQGRLGQASVKGNHAAGASVKIVRHYRLAMEICIKEMEADETFVL